MGLAGFVLLAGLQIPSAFTERNQSFIQSVLPFDSPVYAQGFGDDDSKRKRRNSDIEDIRRNQETDQSTRMQRDQVMDEVKRRFPGAHVLKLKPVGDSVFRARVLTPGGKVKVVNVRAREF